MYALLSILIAVCCLLVMVVLPFRFGSLVSSRLLPFLRKLILLGPREVRFYNSEGGEESLRLWIRIWGGTAAVLFAVFAMKDGAVILDRPEAAPGPHADRYGCRLCARRWRC